MNTSLALPRLASGAPRAEELMCRLALERVARANVELALQRVKSQLATLQAALLETQAVAQHARHCADHDPLTSLANVRCFRQRLAADLARPRPQQVKLAVFFIDLDGFKRINDVHGHGVGNDLLQITANRLRHAVRTEDLVGRLGGDEFACIVDGLPSRMQIRRVACQLFGSICAPITLGDQVFRMRPSIGIALYPGDASSPTALLERADAAMYAAKRRRIGYSFVDAFCATTTPNDSGPHPSMER